MHMKACMETTTCIAFSLDHLTASLYLCVHANNYLLGKGGYGFGSVGCLFICGQHSSKSYERIGMKFYGGVLGSTMKN